MVPPRADDARQLMPRSGRCQRAVTDAGTIAARPIFRPPAFAIAGRVLAGCARALAPLPFFCAWIRDGGLEGTHTPEEVNGSFRQDEGGSWYRWREGGAPA